MSLPQIEARLAALGQPGQPRVARFDRGAELAGRVVVLPSAFNPPTLGHRALLDAVEDRQRAALLSTRNVDKGFEGAALAHRVGMLLAVAAKRSLAVLATCEARIADQATALRQAHPGVRFDFLLGFDTLTRFFDSGYYVDMGSELAAFFAQSGLLAANRGEVGLEEVAEWLRVCEAAAPYLDRIELVELEPHEASLSSTASREAVRRGKEEGLPAEVAAYIESQGLYGARRR